MSEAFGFSLQEYRANEARIASLAQGTKQSEAETETAEMRNALARKAMQTQEEIKAAIRGMPELQGQMGEDPATAVAKLAGVLANAGEVEEASKVLAMSAAAGKATAEAAAAELKTRIVKGEFVASAMQAVVADPGPDSWNAAMIGLLEKFPEDAEGLLQMASAPMNEEDFDYAEKAQALIQYSTTELTKLKQTKEKAEADRLRQVTEESKVRTEVVLPSQARSNDARAIYLEKQGAAKTRLKAATLTDAKQRISLEFSNVDPAQLHGLASELAEATEDIVFGNPLIGRNEALKMAYHRAKLDNKFAGLNPKPGRLGTSARTPLPLPMDDGQIDKAKLRPNKFYQGLGPRRNEGFLWDGKDFYSEEELRSIGKDIDFGVEEPEEGTDEEEPY